MSLDRMKMKAMQACTVLAGVVSLYTAAVLLTHCAPSRHEVCVSANIDGYNFCQEKCWSDYGQDPAVNACLSYCFQKSRGWVCE